MESLSNSRKPDESMSKTRIRGYRVSNRRRPQGPAQRRHSPFQISTNNKSSTALPCTSSSLPAWGRKREARRLLKGRRASPFLPLTHVPSHSLHSIPSRHRLHQTIMRSFLVATATLVLVGLMTLSVSALPVQRRDSSILNGNSPDNTIVVGGTFNNYAPALDHSKSFIGYKAMSQDLPKHRMPSQQANKYCRPEPVRAQACPDPAKDKVEKTHSRPPPPPSEPSSAKQKEAKAMSISDFWQQLVSWLQEPFGL